MDMNFLQQILGPQAQQPQGPDYLSANLSQPQAMPVVPPQPVAPDQAPVDLDPNAMPQPVNPAPDMSGYQAPPIQPSGTGRKRQSAVDIIGRLADVFAKVGGADPLYQSTLNSRADRALALDDHARQVSMDNLKLAGSGIDLSDKQNALLAQGVRGLQALKAAGRDPAAAWPTLAKQIGIPQAQIDIFGQQLANDPNALDAMQAALTDPKDGGKYGKQLSYAHDAAGTLHAFQVDDQANFHSLELPDGWTLADPQQYTNLGDRTIGTGRNSGISRVVLPNGVKPDTVANNTTQRDIAAGHDATSRANAGLRVTTQAQIAQSRAAAKGGDDPSVHYVQAYQQLRTIDGQLNDLQQDPNLPQATGFAFGHASTPAQKEVQGRILALKGLAVPLASSILRANGVSRPAQSEVLRTADGITSDLELLTQGTGDFSARITDARRRFRSQISTMQSNGKRSGWLNGDGTLKPVSGGPATTPQTPVARPVLPGPKRRSSAPSISNW